MKTFLRDAEAILDAAVRSGDPDATSFVLLVDRLGGVRMLDGAGWNLHAMALDFGAQRAYRVERRRGTVRLEGVSGGQTIALEHTVPTLQAIRHTRMGLGSVVPMLMP